MISNFFVEIYMYFIEPFISGSMVSNPDQYMYLWFICIFLGALFVAGIIDILVSKHILKSFFKFVVWQMKHKRKLQERQLAYKRERRLAQQKYYKEMDEMLMIIDRKKRVGDGNA